jgi:hypothetical protein
MPTISEFYGIKIYIYWNDRRHQNAPHFHAEYNGINAAFDLRGNLLVGKLPRRAQILIKELALENQPQLLDAWECAVNLRNLPTIRGLK